MNLLEVSGVQKIYTTRFGGNRVEALKSVSCGVEQGEYVAIMGESGSGKTTLLNILAALDKPTSGSVILDGKDLSKIRESQVAAFRRDQQDRPDHPDGDPFREGGKPCFPCPFHQGRRGVPSALPGGSYRWRTVSDDL